MATGLFMSTGGSGTGGSVVPGTSLAVRVMDDHTMEVAIVDYKRIKAYFDTVSDAELFKSARKAGAYSVPCSGGCGREVEQSTIGQQVWCAECGKRGLVWDPQSHQASTLFGFPVVTSPELDFVDDIVLGDFTERIPITIRKQPDHGNEEGQPLFIATPEKQ